MVENLGDFFRTIDSLGKIINLLGGKEVLYLPKIKMPEVEMNWVLTK